MIFRRFGRHGWREGNSKVGCRSPRVAEIVVTNRLLPSRKRNTRGAKETPVAQKKHPWRKRNTRGAQQGYVNFGSGLLDNQTAAASSRLHATAAVRLTGWRMEASTLAEQAEALCQLIQKKLQHWQQLGEAPEYYALRNRGPYKPTVVHEHNRFGGQMGPYVDAQLKLETVPYINASPIDNLGAGVPHFVATMCPKKQTFAHFWSMVWELGSTMIVNLTHERDKVGSEPTDKRERYWPPFDEATTRHARRWPVQPQTLGCEVCAQVPGLARYAVELQGPNKERRVVRLYWYSRWVDFPSSASIGSKPFFSNAWSVLHMALHILPLLAEAGTAHWAVCHCSAGVGRTGTLIALLSLLQHVARSPSASSLDEAVRHTIECMRERRLWMGKTDIEFATLYAALLLRLRNPREEDFVLSWRLQEGDCASLHAPLTARAAEPSDAEAAAEAATTGAEATPAGTPPPTMESVAGIGTPAASAPAQPGQGQGAAAIASEIAAAIQIDNAADVQRYHEPEATFSPRHAAN